jgi:hypothetical protein
MISCPHNAPVTKLAQFDIGDQDATTFETNFMEPVCSSVGCDKGNAQSFQIVVPSSGFTASETATITMSGFINNDDSLKEGLLSVISQIFLHVNQCSAVTAKKCIDTPEPLNAHFISKSDSGGTGLNCNEVGLYDHS